jgi:hypothetical protein
MDSAAPAMHEAMPDYRRFVRHLWSYRDGHGGSPLTAPPWVYCYRIEDDEGTELRTLNSMVHRLRAHMNFTDRVCSIEHNGSHVVMFQDLEALYLFIGHLWSRADEHEELSGCLIFILENLGMLDEVFI